MFFSLNAFSLISLPSTGARASGMGSSFLSIADGPYAIVFNQAKLSSLSISEMSFSYATGNKFYDFFGFTFPNTMKGGVGIGLLSQSEKALYFSYGRNVREKLSVGGGFKLLKSSNGKKRGIGFDFSILYSIKPNVSYGAILSNILRDDMGLGGGLSFKYKNYLFSLGLKNKDKTTFHFGLETQKRNVFIRCGLDENNLSFGIGGIISEINIDWALSGSSLVFSFGLGY